MKDGSIFTRQLAPYLFVDIILQIGIIFSQQLLPGLFLCPAKIPFSYNRYFSSCLRFAIIKADGNNTDPNLDGGSINNMVS